MDAVEKAVWRFGAYKSCKIAKRIRRILRCMPAIGTYMGEISRQHRTIWDEYCHEVQNGPGRIDLTEAWGTLINPIGDEHIAKLSIEEKRLLFIASDAWEGHTGTEDEEIQFHDGAIEELVLTELNALAQDRDLSKFSE